MSVEVFQVCRNAFVAYLCSRTSPSHRHNSLHVSFSWVEPLQSGHALLLISLSTGCEGRLNVGFVQSYKQAVKKKVERSVMCSDTFILLVLVCYTEPSGKRFGLDEPCLS